MHAAEKSAPFFPNPQPILVLLTIYGGNYWIGLIQLLGIQLFCSSNEMFFHCTKLCKKSLTCKMVSQN